jgi:hypothetical protein
VGFHEFYARVHDERKNNFLNLKPKLNMRDLFVEQVLKKKKDVEAVFNMVVDGKNIKMKFACTPDKNKYEKLTKDKDNIVDYNVIIDGQFMGCVMKGENILD